MEILMLLIVIFLGILVIKKLGQKGSVTAVGIFALAGLQAILVLVAYAVISIGILVLMIALIIG